MDCKGKSCINVLGLCGGTGNELMVVQMGGGRL